MKTIAQLVKLSQPQLVEGSQRQPAKFSKKTKVVVLYNSGNLLFGTEYKSKTSDSVYTLSIEVPFVATRYSGLEVSGLEVKSKRPTTKSPCYVRCGCADFHYTFAMANALSNCLSGPLPQYERTKKKAGAAKRAPRNKYNIPGMCQHLLGFVKLLKKSGYIKPAA